MKIFEVIEAKKVLKSKDDLDDVMDKPEDPDADKIPHILMQLRKAIDVDGDYPITFKDGKKVKLPMDAIVGFIQKYMKARPDDKESLQSQASNSLEGFIAVLKSEEKPRFQQKIKGDRYMSHFRGDFDEK
ncbi:MAG: hypothetical protein EB127_06875 [Alphaproteobacteria bacterium]|nr:hypothetical protein [Alphaproteobacteria bacterium]